MPDRDDVRDALNTLASALLALLRDAEANGLTHLPRSLDTPLLMELRSPLAFRRMNGDPLSTHEKELLAYLDVELDRRLHGLTHLPRPKPVDSAGKQP